MFKREHPPPDIGLNQVSSKRQRLEVETVPVKSEHPNTTEDDGARAVEPKNRPESEPERDDAVATLLEHSYELIRCITALKASPISSQSQAADSRAARQRLAAISQRLLPSVQALASQAPDAGAPATQLCTAAIPSSVAYTKWRSVDIPASLPPLPKIKDAAMERAALHRRPAPSSKGAMTDEEIANRLEWVGDAYLELFSTCFISETFPELSHGKCTQIREQLICNENLGNFTRQYGLDKRATLPWESGNNHNSYSTQKRHKFFGDIFETYVGAVIGSDRVYGVARAASWLKDVWGVQIRDKIVKEERRQESAQGGNGKQNSHSPNPKEELSTMLVVPGIVLRYVDFQDPRKAKKNAPNTKLPLFSMQVVLDGWGEKGLVLGYGSALSKKEAGSNAAKMALENKQLMKKFSAMKAAFVNASRGAQHKAVKEEAAGSPAST